MFDEPRDNLSVMGGDTAVRSAPSRPSPVSCSIDLDATGRSLGHLIAPWSRNESGWGNLLTPIAIIANGDGPTVLLTGGSHGDEFEGPVALRRLVHTLDVDDVSGRIIVVPGLNQAALRAGTRLSPIDGGNMNRSFPGSADGSMTERLADYVTRELVRRADIVLDVHSGGSSMTFEPFVATHELDDEKRTAVTREYLHAFGTDLAVIMSEPDTRGLLDGVVEGRGKIFLTTEIGGGRRVSRRSIEIADRGVTNTLRHAGVIDGQPDVDRRAQVVRMPDDAAALAPFAGLFEPLVETGQHVDAGSTLALVHPLDDLATPPAEVAATVAGVVIMRHCSGLIASGDPVAAVAIPVDGDGGAR